MNIAVVGIGGVGGLVGGALARTHPGIFFLARGENLAAIRERGLRIESVTLGDFVVRPQGVSDKAADIGPMDVVIVACKGNVLQAACETMIPMIHERTVVIPLLNGVMVSDQMRTMLPACVLADGTIRVFSWLETPGHIVHDYGSCRVVLGMEDGSRPQRLEALADLLNRAGIRTDLTGDVLAESWAKYVTMCGNSAVLCWYDGPAGVVREDPDHPLVVRGVAQELFTVATAMGVCLPAGTVDDFVRSFDTLPDQTTTSLYRDLKSGKPARDTELEHILGRMVELGRQTGVPTPYHRKAYERFADQG